MSQGAATVQRRPTRKIRLGSLYVGGDAPITVQSMTNTDTRDVDATRVQIQRLEEAGCEIVRVTAPSIRDAENLHEIRRCLRARRVEVPLGRKNRVVTGYCVNVDPPQTEGGGPGRTFRLKRVKSVLDDQPLLAPHLMDLASWISQYYVCLT